MTGAIAWPQKTREIQDRGVDSTVWNDFKFRDGDIVIATWSKAGTTWMQQIVGQLVFGGDPELEAPSLSPWLDARIPPKEENLPLLEMQTHRRFIKTHLPVDALVFSPKARYIYIGRDGRDIIRSLHNHLVNHLPEVRDQLNKQPGVEGPLVEPPPADIREFWRSWIGRESPFGQSFWDNVRGWWAIRALPNVLLVHHAGLKRDLPGEIRRVAAFLAIPIDETQGNAIVEYCSFEWMKANATKVTPFGGRLWQGGAQTFIHQGVNGRWSETLTPAEIAEYEVRAVEELGPECAHWVATGGNR